MIKIAVCDDEAIAIQDLNTQIKCFMEKAGEKFSVSSFFSGESLLKQIFDDNIHFDVIFLDIQMKDINGIQTAKAIRKKFGDCKIVFVTALKEYVFDAFDVEATNYLIKPIENSKFFEVMEKILASTQSNEESFLTISKNNEIKKVSFHDIIYCEVCNHRVFIYEKNLFHEYPSKIETLEKLLSVDFFRCHRSYLVNLRHVNSYADGFICLPTGEKVPVAARRQKDFMKALLYFQRKEGF